MAVIVDANSGRTVYKNGTVRDGCFVPVSYSYAELAELSRRADSGDVSAAILLSQLDPAEKRLAASLTKVFGKSKKGKVKKGKPPKKLVAAAATAAYLDSLTLSADPFTREAAKSVRAELVKL